MARFHTKAGYFTQVIEKQPVTITQNEHATDENGNLLFEENGTKPLMRVVTVNTTVDVPVTVWVDQVDIPFTPEEEAERDAEEEQTAREQANKSLVELEKSKKALIDSMTLKMSERMLLGEDTNDIRKEYMQKRAAIDKVSTHAQLKDFNKD